MNYNGITLRNEEVMYDILLSREVDIVEVGERYETSWSRDRVDGSLIHG